MLGPSGSVGSSNNLGVDHHPADRENVDGSGQPPGQQAGGVRFQLPDEGFKGIVGGGKKRLLSEREAEQLEDPAGEHAMTEDPTGAEGTNYVEEALVARPICPIDYEPIDEGDVVEVHPGKRAVPHVFSRQAIETWIDSNASGAEIPCPICREPISKDTNKVLSEGETLAVVIKNMLSENLKYTKNDTALHKIAKMDDIVLFRAAILATPQALGFLNHENKDGKTPLGVASPDFIAALYNECEKRTYVLDAKPEEMNKIGGRCVVDGISYAPVYEYNNGRSSEIIYLDLNTRTLCTLVQDKNKLAGNNERDPNLCFSRPGFDINTSGPMMAKSGLWIGSAPFFDRIRVKGSKAHHALMYYECGEVGKKGRYILRAHKGDVRFNAVISEKEIVWGENIEGKEIEHTLKKGEEKEFKESSLINLRLTLLRDDEDKPLSAGETEPSAFITNAPVTRNKHVQTNQTASVDEMIKNHDQVMFFRLQLQRCEDAISSNLDYSPQWFAINSQLSVGWKPENDIVILGSHRVTLSRKHARFELGKDERLTLIDESANGCMVEYVKVPRKKPVPLKKGDLVTFGDARSEQVFEILEISDKFIIEDKEEVKDYVYNKISHTSMEEVRRKRPLAAANDPDVTMADNTMEELTKVARDEGETIRDDAPVGTASSSVPRRKRRRENMFQHRFYFDKNEVKPTVVNWNLGDNLDPSQVGPAEEEVLGSGEVDAMEIDATNG